MLRGVSSALTARRQKLVLFLPQTAEEERELEPYLMAGHVDGVIMYSLHGDDPLPDQLRRKGFPVVVGGLPPPGRRVSYVDNDNRGGAVARDAAPDRAGPRTIATISGPPDMTAADRPPRRPIARPCATRGRGSTRDLEAAGDFTQESGARAMDELLERCPDLDAVFAANDLMAAGPCRCSDAAGAGPRRRRARRLRRLVLALTTRPPLSSVRQSLDVMGRELVTSCSRHRIPGQRAPQGRPDDRARRPGIEWRAADRKELQPPERGPLVGRLHVSRRRGWRCERNRRSGMGRRGISGWRPLLRSSHSRSARVGARRPRSARVRRVVGPVVGSTSPSAVASTAKPGQIINIGGKDHIVVRWYVGLGSGTNPAQIALQQTFVSTSTAPGRAHGRQDADRPVAGDRPDSTATDILKTEIASGSAPDLIGPVGIKGRAGFAGQFLDMTPLSKPRALT